MWRFPRGRKAGRKPEESRGNLRLGGFPPSFRKDFPVGRKVSGGVSLPLTTGFLHEKIMAACGPNETKAVSFVSDAVFRRLILFARGCAMAIDYIKAGQLVLLLVQTITKSPKDKDLPLPPEIVGIRAAQPTPRAASVPATSMPTTTETVAELKRRLGKELYRMELDLMGGGRIAGKPCDCLSAKHTFGLEATAEELMAYERNPVYEEVTTWLKKHQKEFEPTEIAKREPSYYQGLIPDVRNLRKRVMGTENLAAIISPQEVDAVKKRAMELIESRLAGSTAA